MANWIIDKSDGSYRILDPAGQERGRFADADTLAVHLAGCMEELDAARFEVGKLTKIMRWVAGNTRDKWARDYLCGRLRDRGHDATLTDPIRTTE